MTLYVLWLIVVATFWTFWLLIAFMLFPLKVFAIRGVKQLWLKVWNPDNFEVCSSNGNAIDTGHLNRGFLSEFLLETLPQLVLRNPVVERFDAGYRLRVELANAGTGAAWLEVEASGDPANASESSRVRVRVTPETPAQLVWNLTFRPRRIVVDPDVRLLQIEREKAFLDLPEIAERRIATADV